jgi:hypothetical protein
MGGLMRKASHDPLTGVAEPMSEAEAAAWTAWAEEEIRRNREAILKDCISVREAAELIGRSRQSIERLRRENRRVALRSGKQWRYPRWQFEPDAPGGVIPGLEEVLRILEFSPVAISFWLFEPYEQLGGTPAIDLLRRNRIEPVIQLALEHSYLP